MEGEEARPKINVINYILGVLCIAALVISGYDIYNLKKVNDVRIETINFCNDFYHKEFQRNGCSVRVDNPFENFNVNLSQP